MNKLRTAAVVTPLLIFFILIAGFIAPERIQIPVAGATISDWNKDSFWYEPWGASGVHKGIDIFGKKGTPVISAVDGIVIFAGKAGIGGNVVVVLGPKWRFHYYAHLDTVDTSAPAAVKAGNVIGTLGNSGNARGKPPHLHYAIVRLFPAPWAIDDSTQGRKKAFFIDPNAYLRDRARELPLYKTEKSELKVSGR
jgi:murein DD-endopeptidase MepM/ murein hydrolase activator NlpD